VRVEPGFKSRPTVDEKLLSIGELAARARVSTSAIRFYERRGLLHEPDRVSGRRRYGNDMVRRLEVIDIAKRVGFSLAEVRLLLDASDGGEPTHERLRALADDKLPEVRALIARGEAMREWLELARTCTCSSLELCALFERR
jgi:DNA-binding transcriptional MerR regulator